MVFENFDITPKSQELTEPNSLHTHLLLAAADSRDKPTPNDLPSSIEFNDVFQKFQNTPDGSKHLNEFRDGFAKGIASADQHYRDVVAAGQARMSHFGKQEVIDFCDRQDADEAHLKALESGMSQDQLSIISKQIDEYLDVQTNPQEKQKIIADLNHNRSGLGDAVIVLFDDMKNPVQIAFTEISAEVWKAMGETVRDRQIYSDILSKAGYGTEAGALLQEIMNLKMPAYPA